MSKFGRLVLVLSCLAPAAPAPAADKVPVAVMEFSSKGGVTQKQMDALQDMLANEIRALGNYRVIGKSDIDTALDLEQRSIMVGCNQVSCFAEIGGALGVRWVVVGNISMFGESYLLNLKVLDVEKVQVVGGVSRKVEGGEGELIDALSAGTRELFQQSGPIMQGTGSDTVPREISGSEARPEISHPPAKPPAGPRSASFRNTWGHVTFWSGTGFAVLGCVALAAGLSQSDTYADTQEAYTARVDALGASRTWTSVMWTGLGAGLFLMATGTALWVWESFSDQAGVSASAAPTPDGQGWVFGLGGRW